MPNFLKLISYTLLASRAVFAAPTDPDSTDQNDSTSPDNNSSSLDSSNPYFYLRVNNKTEGPWGGRWIVNLIDDNYLGLENFTVHPATPPVKFIPIPLADGTTFALVTEPVADGQDPNSVPQLVAVTTKDDPQSVELMIISNSTTNGPANAKPCPDGKQCFTDLWDEADGDEDDDYELLVFGGFNGTWIPVIDAKPHGWHVYWTTGDGTTNGENSTIILDLVPCDGDPNCT